MAHNGSRGDGRATDTHADIGNTRTVMAAPGTALLPVVQRFMRELTPALQAMSAKVTERDVALEAFNIAASFVDADGRHTDDELAELIVAFAPWLDHLVGATPAAVRANQLTVGARAWK